MTPNQRPSHRPARTPDDLSRLFLDRANAGDVEGIVALYEPDAVVRFPGGPIARGHDEIREAYRQLLAPRPRFVAGAQREPLVSGGLALTSTATPSGRTAEIARRQADGTWRWAIDDPALAP